MMKFYPQILLIIIILLCYTITMYYIGYKAGVRSMDVIVKKEVCKQ